MSQRIVEFDDKNVGTKRKHSSEFAVGASNNKRQALKSVCHVPESKMGFPRRYNTNRRKPSRFVDDLANDNTNMRTRFVPNRKFRPRYHNNNNNTPSSLVLHRDEKGIRTSHFMKQARQINSNNNNATSNNNQYNRNFSPVSTLSSISSSSSLPDEGTLEADIYSNNTKNKVEFLETYITTLKNQILFKDKKLHRLQREHPFLNEDNKDTLLQASLDRHEEMYQKYKALEAYQKLLVKNKEKLEIKVKELQALNENLSKENEIKGKTIHQLSENITKEKVLHGKTIHQLSETLSKSISSSKVESQRLKQHYEQELHQKLQEYQVQCYEYLKQAIRPYQIKLQAAEMQMSQMMHLQNIFPQTTTTSTGMIASDSTNVTTTTAPSSTMNESRIFDGRFGESRSPDQPSSTSNPHRITDMEFLADMQMVLNS